MRPSVRLVVGLGMTSLLFTAGLMARPNGFGNLNSSVQVTPPGLGFGLTAGMTKLQLVASVGRSALIKDQGDVIWLSSAPIPDEDFNTYVVYVSATTGISKVNAISRRVAIVPDPEELKTKYNQIRNSMESRYGASTTLLTPAAVWKSGGLFSSWMSEDGANISLDVQQVSRAEGIVTITYEYPNFPAWLREHSAWFKFHLASQRSNASAAPRLNLH